MSLAIDYVSKNGKIAACYDSMSGNWYFFEVRHGVSTDMWSEVVGPYAEWRSEMIEMTERLSEREGTSHRF